VYPAGVVESSLAALGSSAQPQAPALSATGKGVSVALLDGPLDTSHPYLAGATLTPWNAVTDQPREDDPTPDAALHATYMAGIIAGSGGPAGLTGVAPGAKILPIQVMAMDRGVLVGTTSSLLAGIDRALDPNGDGNLADHAQVIVAPVSEPFAAFGDTPEALAAEGAEKAGALVIAAAGNDGPTGSRFGTVSTPASAASWLAVGSTDGRATLPQVGVTLDTGSSSQSLDAVPLAGPVGDGRRSGRLPLDRRHEPRDRQGGADPARRRRDRPARGRRSRGGRQGRAAVRRRPDRERCARSRRSRRDPRRRAPGLRGHPARDGRRWRR
jgi:subtilisin family serine protease